MSKFPAYRYRPGFPPAIEGYNPPEPYTKPGKGCVLLRDGPQPPLDEETRKMFLRHLLEYAYKEGKLDDATREEILRTLE